MPQHLPDEPETASPVPTESQSQVNAVSKAKSKQPSSSAPRAKTKRPLPSSAPKVTKQSHRELHWPRLLEHDIIIALLAD